MKRCPCYVLLVLLAVVAGACTGPGATPTATYEEFSIYLLAQDTPVSQMSVTSHLELADKPLISTSDVISYTKETHEIELTPDAYRRILGLDIPVDGRVFVVCVDRHPIYWGAFWTSISSTPFDGVTIMKPFAPDERLVQIQLGYPAPQFFTGKDPRSDPEILQSLERVQRLR